MDKLEERYGNSTSVTCAYDYGVEGEEDEEYVLERFSLNQYMYLGIHGVGNVISETEGRLADFFEKTKPSFLENGGTKYNYLS